MLNNNEKILYSGVVVVVVGLGMYMLRQSKTTVETTKAITYQDITTETNRVKSIDKFEKAKMAVGNVRTAPKLDSRMHDVHDSMRDGSASGINLEGERNHAEKDSIDPAVYEAPMESLENQINKKQVNDQQALQWSNIKKQKFIADYKARALAMGYKVELNDRLELIRAEKIKGNDRAPRVGEDVMTHEEDQYLEDEE